MHCGCLRRIFPSRVKVGELSGRRERGILWSCKKRYPVAPYSRRSRKARSPLSFLRLDAQYFISLFLHILSTCRSLLCCLTSPLYVTSYAVSHYTWFISTINDGDHGFRNVDTGPAAHFRRCSASTIGPEGQGSLCQSTRTTLSTAKRGIKSSL